jgi:hypothetical protein
MASSRPRQPETVDEHRRVAHVFFGGAFAAGEEFDILVSSEPPHRVFAVRPSSEEAWKRPLGARTGVVWLGPIVSPGAPFPSEDDPGRVMRPCFHDPATEPEVDDDGREEDDDDNNKTEDRRGAPRVNEITKAELRLEWTQRGRTFYRTWRIRKAFDAIFLTRGAMEMFFYPHYEASFGRTYTQQLRERIGHGR